MLKLFELFDSIQGEGSRVGIFTTFVRFGGCNLVCTWCDEPDSIPLKKPPGMEEKKWEKIREEITPVQLWNRIRFSKTKDICITGGEPLIQPKDDLARFCEILKKHKRFISIESNGTRYIEELMPLVDLWSLSPKLSSSDNNVNHNAWISNIRQIQEHKHERARIQLKFVIGSVEDAMDMRQYLDALQDIPIYLQSVFDDAKWEPIYTVIELKQLLDQVAIDYKWKKRIRFGMQYHKIFGVK